MIKKRVLIVEDETISAEYIRLTLEKQHYEVAAIVPSGEEAIAAVEHDPPDLILMDIGLAGELDGIEAADTIRSRFDIPFVYLSSGVTEDEILTRIQRSDPYAYILKPCNERELLINIEIALHKHHMECKIQHLNAVLRAIRHIDRLVTHEKDRTVLLQNACSLLIELRGYHSVWIAVLEHPERLRLAAHAGLGEFAEALSAFLQQDTLPQCARWVLSHANEVFVDNAGAACQKCPLADSHKTLSVMSVSLASEQTIYGIINAWLPEQFARQDEEHTLLQKIANDIAFALHGIEQEQHRKQAEQELATERTLLTKRVEERTAELIEANILLQREVVERQHAQAELQQAKESAEFANRAKSEFLSTMNHELRTPLNAILGYAQIFKHAENLTEAQRQGFDTIQTCGTHLLNLINDSLELSKIEAGRLELRTRAFQFLDLLTHIVQVIRIRAQQKGVIFTYIASSELPVGVRADEKRLQEVLINLLDNAVKFTPKGGRVTLRVTSCEGCGAEEETEQNKPKKLATHSSYPIIHVRFEVSDTGIGIAPNDLEHIFSPFQQIGGHESSGEGTGLGLAISRKLVRIMGGEIFVKSGPEQGSVFWFILPLSDIPDFSSQDAIYDRKLIGYVGKRMRIMVVDDNSTNRAVLVGMLLALGFEVIEADNGLEGVKKACELQPDLIFLDLRMPGLDGFGVTQRLRNTEKGCSSSIPIIAVSASVFEETRERALNVGFTDFLIKPVEYERLLELLQQHLRLEWQYEQEYEPQEHETSHEQETNFSHVTLPAEELEQLFVSASKGRIKNLLNRLSQLEADNPDYKVFTAEIRQLAKQFKAKEIIQYLAQMMGKDEYGN